MEDNWELTWDQCLQHVWEDCISSQCGRACYCTKCGMPGERDDTVEGGVYYPAT